MPRRPFVAQLFLRQRMLQALLVAAFVLAWPSKAHAYAWMIRHGYAQCAQCHVDISGGGPLTTYGRAMGEVVLRTRYTWERRDDEEIKLGKFLLGAVNLPEELELGGDVRVLSLHSKIDNIQTQQQLIWMQLDGHAALQ